MGDGTELSTDGHCCMTEEHGSSEHVEATGFCLGVVSDVEPERRDTGTVSSGCYCNGTICTKISKNCEHVVCGTLPAHLENDSDPDGTFHATKVLVDDMLSDTMVSACPRDGANSILV